MSDKAMVYLIVGMLLLAWVLRFLLAKARGETRHPIWILQGLIFPVALMVTEIIYESTGKDYMFGVIFFCIAEELICWGIRKKSPSPGFGGPHSGTPTEPSEAGPLGRGRAAEGVRFSALAENKRYGACEDEVDEGRSNDSQ